MLAKIALLSSFWLLVYSQSSSDVNYQEFSPAIDYGLEHSIEERSAGGSHSEYETIAQGLCMSMTINNGQHGCTFAVRRRCYRLNGETCNDLCSARSLASLDEYRNRHRTGRWKAIGAVHVYHPRPYSYRSTVTHPRIGFKVLWHDDYQSEGGCGPNYCCCFVQLEDIDAHRNPHTN